MRFIPLLSLGILFTIYSTGIDSSELIVNGGFETNSLSPWTTQVYQGGLGGVGTAYSLLYPVNTGSYSLQGIGNIVIMAYQTVVIPVGGSSNLSFYYKTGSNSGQPRMFVVIDQVSNPINNIWSDDGVIIDWNRVDLSISTYADGLNHTIGFYFNLPNIGQAYYVDDISLMYIPPSPSPTSSVTPSSIPSISSSPTCSVSPSMSRSISPSISVSPSISPSSTISISPSYDVSPNASSSPSISLVSSPSPSITSTPTITTSPSPSPNLIIIPIVSLSSSPSITPTIILSSNQTGETSPLQSMTPTDTKASIPVNLIIIVSVVSSGLLGIILGGYILTHIKKREVEDRKQKRTIRRLDSVIKADLELSEVWTHSEKS